MSEKLRIYLDTNVIYGYFKRRIEEQKIGKTYIEPEAMKFLKEKSNLIQSFTSFFSLLEVAKNLRENKDITCNEIVTLFRYFRNKYPIKILGDVKITEETLKWYYEGIEIKDTIQLNIAKNKELWFVSGDKRLIEIAKKIYPNSFTFEEFKKYLTFS